MQLPLRLRLKESIVVHHFPWLLDRCIQCVYVQFTIRDLVAKAYRPDHAIMRANMGSYCSKKDDSKLQSASHDSSRAEEPDFQLFKLQILDETPLSDEHELNRAVSYYEDMVQRDPDNPDWHVKAGFCLFAKGQTAPAEAHLRKALTRGEADSNTHYTLGLICQRSGRLEEAKAHYSRAVARDHAFAKGHNKLGEVLAAEKDHEGALRAFQLACDLQPASAEMRNNLGAALLALDRAKDATVHLQTAVALDPSLARAHNNLANAYRKQGKLNESIKHYILAIDKTPRRHFAAAHLNLAAAYFDSGDTASALRHFEEAMHIGTHIHKVMVAKGYHLLFKHPRIREAIEYYLSQKYEGARDLLTEIRSGDKKNLIVTYYLASAMLKLGNEERAKALFLQVVKLGRTRGNLDKHFLRQFVHRTEKVLASIEGDFDEQDSEQPSILERSELLNESINVPALPPSDSKRPVLDSPETAEEALL